MAFSEQQADIVNNLDDISTFSGKLKYITDSKLPSLGSGSGRIVFDFGDGLALKLAKNEVEEEHGRYNDLKHLLTQVSEAAKDSTWIIAELARKITSNQFKALTGVRLDELKTYLIWFDGNVLGRNRKYGVTSIDKDFQERMQENEFVIDLTEYIGNYGVPIGDLARVSSYGVVNRGDGDRIVIVDYGLSEDVLDNYYSRRNEDKEWNQRMKVLSEDDETCEDNNQPDVLEIIRREIYSLNEKHIGYMPGSNIVQVKKECTVGGLGNTSKACNQGDMNNLVLSKVNEMTEEGNYIYYDDKDINYIKFWWDRVGVKYQNNQFFKKLYILALKNRKLTLDQHDNLLYLLKNGKSMYDAGILTTKN